MLLSVGRLGTLVGFRWRNRGKYVNDDILLMMMMVMMMMMIYTNKRTPRHWAVPSSAGVLIACLLLACTGFDSSSRGGCIVSLFHPPLLSTSLVGFTFFCLFFFSSRNKTLRLYRHPFCTCCLIATYLPTYILMQIYQRTMHD